jgi:hypothetical protein
VYGGGSGGRCDVPPLLKAILQEGRWKARKLKTGESASFARFEEFVTAKPLQGLGGDMDTLKRLCGADPETLDLIDKAVKGQHGGDRRSESIKVNNVDVDREERPRGNSRQKAIRDLRDKQPEIHARVMAGELSPHAGMVVAGLRTRSITIPDDPAKAARILARHFQGDRWRALIRLRRARPIRRPCLRLACFGGRPGG